MRRGLVRCRPAGPVCFNSTSREAPRARVGAGLSTSSGSRSRAARQTIAGG